ncbi:MAG: triose-phosphate isomerase [bacterium]
MYKGYRAAKDFIRTLAERVGDVNDREVVVFPPFTSIPAVAEVLQELHSPIRYGAQDVFWESEGPFTGEVSPTFLAELGCRYVIVGHSERRHLLGETDEMCRCKVAAALRHGIRAILCCGETLQEREAGETNEVIKRQITAGLAGVSEGLGFDIAYEPVWAIGTGKNATSEQIHEVHSYIRYLLCERYGSTEREIRIIYGGSVRPTNIDNLLGQAEIDGVLVGGASLDIDGFLRIVNYQR